MDVPTPYEPYLWNNPTFDFVDFVDHLFSFSRNFPGDYKMLFSMSLTQKSNLLEVWLMRCFLVEKVLRDKCSDTLERVQSWMINLNKRAREGRVVLKQMKVRRGYLKVLAKKGKLDACLVCRGGWFEEVARGSSKCYWKHQRAGTLAYKWGCDSLCSPFWRREKVSSPSLSSLGFKPHGSS